MRITIILILIAIILIPTTAVHADNLTTMPGGKVNTHMPIPKPERSITHNDLMQDLTQCQIVNGQVLCVDVCGGISVPYTVCSYE